ncbi:CRISPR-associated helicase/endonuclease Cas3 [Halothermothrix orenii]|uniref:CRISPR-associated helicase Cas3 n=1 Tax=Halothermothrix orenii (strain H 168 / OCM 544 / DSM 9562) TaxID=373903 RepID=B8CYA2_HALOH|nr:CRISPR-associated helicase/endonuclease Cas3 [Halothermothrix orenii]ACL70271.1 CRISPR-associated helicase Cas3 [Halothermothrix orenii H 168]
MEKLFSHYSSNKKRELEVHLKNVAEGCKNIILNKRLDLSIISKDELTDIAFLIGAVHDFGKSTTFFQNYLVHGEENIFSHHGLISAILAYILLKKKYTRLMAMIGYMVVKRHHGNLESPVEDCGETFYHIKMQINDIKQNTYNHVKNIYDNNILKDTEYCFEELFSELEEFVVEVDDISELFREIVIEDKYKNEDKAIELFLVTNLLYSILIDTDKKDAASLNNDYFKGATEEYINVQKYINKKRKEQPKKYNPGLPINKARNSFFQDVTNHSQIKDTNFLYSLTAPTGIGKTFASFAFANKLRELSAYGKRIIYCLPYTSIIDQNFNEFEKIINFNLKEVYKKNPSKYLLKHHYLTPLELKKNIDLEKDSRISRDLEKYLDDRLLLESWESGNIVTTFVQLLESIIGNKNSYLKKFHNIVNSVVILDEVQNIPVEYYHVVGKVLKILGKNFNTHILLMTATQPEIIYGNDVVNLVNEKKYNEMNVFDRVNLKIIDKLNPYNIEDFLGYLELNFNSKTGLIVCNTISSALDIYKYVDELFTSKGYHVYSLTTNLTPIDRLEKIDEINMKIDKGEKIIVVSTQLIEAGVDLSFEEVFRDFAPLDSIIQVAGRCNRSGELPQKGKVNIIMLKNDKEEMYCNKVYDKVLLDICREVLSEKKSFIDMSKNYFSRIRESYLRQSDKLMNAICNLNYSKEKVDQDPISKFKIVKEQGGKDNIIICKNKDIENKIEELKEIYEEIKLSYNDRKKLNRLIAKKEILNKELALYKINVYTNQLKEYEKHYIIKKFRFIKYVSYEDQKKYLYDDNIGFLKEPKKKFESTMFA